MKKKNALMLIAGTLPALAAAQDRPNIIYIMCDDMGYGDLGCYGQQLISTPNLDKMAAEGMRFTQAYAGSPVSAPSRASFMTGQHTGHVHVRGNRENWQSARQENMFGSNPDYRIIGQEPYKNTHKIVPELFKEAGYRTGMFGKWAGGYYNLQYPDTYKVDAQGNTITSASGTSSSASLPNKRGIDCYYGPICQFQAHTYYPNFLNRYDPEKYGDKHIVVDTLKQNIQHKDVASGSKDYENREQYASDLIHLYALEWIDRQTEDKPFIGIFTYTLPHAELWQPNDSLVAKYTERFKGQDSPYGGNFGSWYYRNYARHAQFAAMVNRLDTQIGEIFDKLKEKGFKVDVDANFAVFCQRFHIEFCFQMSGQTIDECNEHFCCHIIFCSQFGNFTFDFFYFFADYSFVDFLFFRQVFSPDFFYAVAFLCKCFFDPAFI